ncbi:predicted protein [Arabidopsis lyrata subsp. lyrata]|uniref:Predicted protein n=1 Tax=Arabidopsis lyrata subsp. lyrata TaxID=81972 RepID=D7LYP4_ARALL|nr:predicted protein [Arabidopsis lyrata subsp. lyrata]
MGTSKSDLVMEDVPEMQDNDLTECIKLTESTYNLLDMKENIRMRGYHVLATDEEGRAFSVDESGNSKGTNTHKAKEGIKEGMVAISIP